MSCRVIMELRKGKCTLLSKRCIIILLEIDVNGMIRKLISVHLVLMICYSKHGFVREFVMVIE